MQIVLLSGGSGKRLWPLSNDVRSKQFIKIFKKDESETDYESMVQRIYRQIKEVDTEDQITIATSKKQVSAIINQLGGDVSISVEPCRRDTFPAIALAVSYLHDVLGISEEEPVVVCPVDPYVDKGFFSMLKELEKLVLEGNSNICLMGIEPTYPSEKYGYIVPENNKLVSRVLSFKEKPDCDSAKKYIAQGGLWNAGVFAFKLGYILAKSHELIDFMNYKDLYHKYADLTKISFDYAIMEKETNVQVIRYSGEWKDLGTWNTFSEAMRDSTMGYVITDQKCTNTNVINELSIPVICMGIKDAVVAVSGDGVLVSDKRESSEIKSYVEQVDAQIMFAEKSWGNFIVLDVQDTSMTIKIELKENQHLTYHSHEHRDEVWTVISGTGIAIIDDKEYTIQEGSVLTMRAGQKHMVKAISELSIIEVQTGNEIDVNDKMKY